MTDYAEPSVRRSREAADGVRFQRGSNSLPAVMTVAIVAMVVLALIAEARMTPEARAAVFDVYCYM